MQFLVIAHDYPNVFEKRMEVRPKHLEKAEKLIAQGILQYGIGMLNEKDQLAGSVMLFEVASREELDAILKDEIYIQAKIWKKITITPARVGPYWQK